MQDALAQFGLNRLRIESIAELEAALGAAAEDLAISVAPILVIVVGVFAGLHVVLGANLEPALLEGDFDVLLVESRQRGVDRDPGLGLIDVDRHAARRRDPAPAQCCERVSRNEMSHV